jgi:hypothetical protein
MCYTGECGFEDVWGNCTLLKKYPNPKPFQCPGPEDDEEEDPEKE